MSPAVRKRRIAVLGSRSVGKSSLVNKFVHDVFEEPYHPTIELTSTKSMVINGVEYECDIIDTAGQDEFTIFNRKYAIGIHGYVLVYSIASPPSYNMIQIIYDKIVDCWGVTKVPCVIVGSKCDLLEPQKLVDREKAEEFAHGLGCAFTETSAKKGINVDKVFELCLKEIEKNKSPSSASKPTDQTEPGSTKANWDCAVQ